MACRVLVCEGGTLSSCASSGSELHEGIHCTVELNRILHQGVVWAMVLPWRGALPALAACGLHALQPLGSSLRMDASLSEYVLDNCGIATTIASTYLYAYSRSYTGTRYLTG